MKQFYKENDLGINRMVMFSACAIYTSIGEKIEDGWKEVALMKDFGPLIWTIYKIFSRFSYDCHKSGRSHITGRFATFCTK